MAEHAGACPPLKPPADPTGGRPTSCHTAPTPPRRSKSPHLSCSSLASALIWRGGSGLKTSTLVFFGLSGGCCWLLEAVVEMLASRAGMRVATAARKAGGAARRLPVPAEQQQGHCGRERGGEGRSGELRGREWVGNAGVPVHASPTSQTQRTAAPRHVGCGRPRVPHASLPLLRALPLEFVLDLPASVPSISRASAASWTCRHAPASRPGSAHCGAGALSLQIRFTPAIQPHVAALLLRQRPPRVKPNQRAWRLF